MNVLSLITHDLSGCMPVDKMAFFTGSGVSSNLCIKVVKKLPTILIQTNGSLATFI